MKVDFKTPSPDDRARVPGEFDRSSRHVLQPALGVREKVHEVLLGRVDALMLEPSDEEQKRAAGGGRPSCEPGWPVGALDGITNFLQLSREAGVFHLRSSSGGLDEDTLAKQPEHQRG
ncbi:hypothetical protein [Vitiosangium sp. GDMCC 1.1324]|uniref:hypothetical protein n=1 Tax=Vitiosangium sp. (strain GDMCC 1.1324) TaxID=2138576 RepID=UPI0011B537C6|nr:hypothetical protein [Vitiosangium sp. GDMCC 1.1324]